MIIKDLWFDPNQYYKTQYKKTQIVIHHTVSPNDKYVKNGITGDVNWWLSNQERVATCCIISSTGLIYKLFDSFYWAHHLGIPRAVFDKFALTNINTLLNKQSIGIELDSFGPLELINNKFTPADPNLKNKYFIDKQDVVEYTESYRGYKYYEKYTQEQINSLSQLLVNWSENYNIPLNYNESMWDVDEKALMGKPGIWSHTSYRFDKSDCHPQPELIQMLKSLTAPKIYTPDQPTVFTDKYREIEELKTFLKTIINGH